MSPMRQHTVRANGIRQHYLEAGSGPPVVLLHGLPETNCAWRHQIPVLAERYHVSAPDLRGYGETDKPAAGYDERTMACDLVELLNETVRQSLMLVTALSPVIGYDLASPGRLPGVQGEGRRRRAL